MAPGCAFCRDCGARGRGQPSHRRRGERGGRAAWIAAAGLGVALLGVVIAFLAKQRTPRCGPGTDGSAALGWRRRRDGPEGTPPDISNMSPKERYRPPVQPGHARRRNGDQATVDAVHPHDGAWPIQQLDSVDADARFHMAMLLLHTGQVPGAPAEADSILKFSPGHLFGYMIRGTVARWDKDARGPQEGPEDFLGHYDTRDEGEAARVWGARAGRDRLPGSGAGPGARPPATGS